jgi:hypothetical protein
MTQTVAHRGQYDLPPVASGGSAETIACRMAALAAAERSRSMRTSVLRPS